MKAMILAAGRGKRLSPLTDQVPKPLLQIAGTPLIVYHLINLKKIGVTEIVINVAYLAEQIRSALGDGSQYGVKVTYSYESVALETGGGIFQALPLLGEAPFMVISADIWTEYPLQNLPQKLEGLAHLIMVDNPSFHPKGDYGLVNNKLTIANANKLTYASFGVLHPRLFTNCHPGSFRLTEVLIPAIQVGEVTGQYYQGPWANIGTLEDLEALNDKLEKNFN